MTPRMRSGVRLALVTVSLVLTTFSSAACRSNRSANPPVEGRPSDRSVDGSAAKGSTADSPAADRRETYVLAFLVSGKTPGEKTPEERQAIQAAHMTNIGKLVGEGKMVIAGPFGHPSPDDSMRGIFVFDTESVAKATEWTETDPAVKAGVLGMELSQIRTQTKLRRALEIYRESLAKAGGEPGKDEMRGYAVVLIESKERATESLSGLRDAGKVVFEGELAGSARGGYFVVLDAEDEEGAKILLEPIAATMGEHSIFPWWATVTLLELKPGGT